MSKKTVRDIDLSNKRVLMRADFNVPLAGGEISDDARIRAALPTIAYLLEQGASLVVMSHLGRPKGQVKPELSLAPVAERLGRLLSRAVKMAPDCVGAEVKAMANQLQPGEVLLLENTRFHAGEKQNSPELARQLAELGEVYVNDAFGTAHRAHASTEGVTHHLPAVAGFLIEKEIEILGRVSANPDQPCMLILGGAKVSDKIGVIENLRHKVEKILTGGSMANTMLAAQGYDLGRSLVEAEVLDTARNLLTEAGDQLLLPVDLVAAEAFDNDAVKRTVPVDGVPAGWQALDIGQATIERFKETLGRARTVIWNGPVGVFELPSFARGTMAIAEVLAGIEGTTVIGGGDSAAAAKEAGVADRITHVSTGGGASLELLEGKVLPGVAALLDR
jgi:phosphoglycerate kinase